MEAELRLELSQKQVMQVLYSLTIDDCEKAIEVLQARIKMATQQNSSSGKKSETSYPDSFLDTELKDLPFSKYVQNVFAYHSFKSARQLVEKTKELTNLRGVGKKTAREITSVLRSFEVVAVGEVSQ